jgi:hypothetical protein
LPIFYLHLLEQKARPHTVFLLGNLEGHRDVT